MTQRTMTRNLLRTSVSLLPLVPLMRETISHNARRQIQDRPETRKYARNNASIKASVSANCSRRPTPDCIAPALDRKPFEAPRLL